MNDNLYQYLYYEFGREQTHIARRELTAENGHAPTYIELLVKLILEQKELREEAPP